MEGYNSSSMSSKGCLQCQVAKMAKKEMLPSTKPYTDSSGRQASDMR